MDLRTQPKSRALRACLALLMALPAVAGWGRAQSQDPVAVTLPEAVQIALARHPDVEKTRAAASQMKGRIREVRAQALPEVNFHSSLQRWMPLSLAGVAGLLFLSGDTVNIMSTIGLILVVGLAAKNAILLVDFADVQRRTGVTRGKALIAAAGEAGGIRREFFDRYVFPDTEMVPLDVVLRNAEGAGFEIRHIESMRQDYVLTLRAWRQNLEKAAGQAQAMVGEKTYRIWRLYLAASAYSFNRGHHSVFQSLLIKRAAGQA
jgi:hypothetical protein